MTQARTDTRKSDRRRPRPWTNARDLFNTYACVADPKAVASMDQAFRQMLDRAARCAGDSLLDLYVDGSWNPDAKAAGIGIAAVTDGSRRPWEHPNSMLGKPVRAKDAMEAETYALAIGIAYVLDTFPGRKYVRVRYDCSRTPVCAANLDAYADRGAPYTNLRSAMARARRSGVSVLFEHVKAHAGNGPNEACDILAKHHARIPLNVRQKNTIAAMNGQHQRKEAKYGRHSKTGS